MEHLRQIKQKLITLKLVEDKYATKSSSVKNFSSSWKTAVT